MTVVNFPATAQRNVQGWNNADLKHLVGACAPAVANGESAGWEIGETETGDPQLYVMGPPPDHECILVVSRLGRLYVVEDGRGEVLFEHDNPMMVAEQVCTSLRRQKTAIVARIAVAWCAFREFIEEKVEPVVAEPIELISHYGPHFAALA
jgi:hypothetical protein